MGTTKVTCPVCKSKRVWLKGKVPTRKGPKARYICYECGRSFYAPKRVSKPSKPRTKKAK